MKQTIVLSVLLLFLSSPAAIQARDKSHLANSPAPGPSNSNCSDIIFDMMPCLSYLTLGSNDTVPVKECCDGIETVLNYNPQCICTGLTTSQEMGITLNNTRALAMPKTCKIPIAPPHCADSMRGASTPGASTPVMSPVSPSVETPPSSPSSTATSPSSAESPGSTASSPSNSGVNNILIPTFSLVATFVSFVAYISIFTY